MGEGVESERQHSLNMVGSGLCTLGVPETPSLLHQKTLHIPSKRKHWPTG